MLSDDSSSNSDSAGRFKTSHRPSNERHSHQERRFEKRPDRGEKYNQPVKKYDEMRPKSSRSGYDDKHKYNTSKKIEDRKRIYNDDKSKYYKESERVNYDETRRSFKEPERIDRVNYEETRKSYKESERSDRANYEEPRGSYKESERRERINYEETRGSYKEPDRSDKMNYGETRRSYKEPERSDRVNYDETRRSYREPEKSDRVNYEEPRGSYKESERRDRMNYEEPRGSYKESERRERINYEETRGSYKEPDRSDRVNYEENRRRYKEPERSDRLNYDETRRSYREPEKSDRVNYEEPRGSYKESERRDRMSYEEPRGSYKESKSQHETSRSKYGSFERELYSADISKRHKSIEKYDKTDDTSLEQNDYGSRRLINREENGKQDRHKDKQVRISGASSIKSVKETKLTDEKYNRTPPLRCDESKEVTSDDKLIVRVSDPDMMLGKSSDDRKSHSANKAGRDNSKSTKKDEHVSDATSGEKNDSETINLSDTSEDEYDLRQKLISLEKKLKKTKKKEKKLCKLKRGYDSEEQSKSNKHLKSELLNVTVISSSDPNGGRRRIVAECGNVKASEKKRKEESDEEGEIVSDCDESGKHREFSVRSSSHMNERNIKNTSDGVEGPALPPHLVQNENRVQGPSISAEMRQQLAIEELEDEDEEEIFGPLPPRPDKMMSEKQRKLEERALQIKMASFDQSDKSQYHGREEWMLELPEAKAKFLGLGPRNFRSKPAPDMSDRSSWTDTPKEKALKASGVVVVTEEKIKQKLKSDAEAQYIEERDKEQEREAREYKKKHKRDKSLLEMHRKKLEKEKKKLKESRGGGEERRPFSREVDLKANQFDEARKNVLLKRAGQLNDKFLSGQAKFL